MNTQEEQQSWHWMRRLVHRHGVWPTVCAMTLIAIVYSVLVGVALDLLLKPAIVWMDLLYCIVIPALVAPIVSYAAIRLLHELEVAERKLRQLASKDSLTGLGTRRHFLELAEWAMEKSRRSGQPTSMLMMDADHFKQINDTFGHAVGDRVLVAIGQVIQNVCRTADLAGRYGGEEFSILLPTTPAAMAVAVAERLRSTVEAEVAQLAGLEQAVTVSIGIATSDAGKTHLPQLIEQADAAMYAAKHAGRNCVRVDGAEGAP